MNGKTQERKDLGAKVQQRYKLTYGISTGAVQLHDVGVIHARQLTKLELRKKKKR